AQLTLEIVAMNGGPSIWNEIEATLTDSVFEKVVQGVLSSGRHRRTRVLSGLFVSGRDRGDDPWDRNRRIRVLTSLFFTERGWRRENLRTRLIAEILKAEDEIDRAELLFQIAPFIPKKDSDAAWKSGVDLVCKNFSDHWVKTLHENRDVLSR